MTTPKCPQCGQEMLESFVAPEFERSSFGDYFCGDCPRNREGGLFCYWWKEELPAESFPEHFEAD